MILTVDDVEYFPRYFHQDSPAQYVCKIPKLIGEVLQKIKLSLIVFFFQNIKKAHEYWNFFLNPKICMYCHIGSTS